MANVRCTAGAGLSNPEIAKMFYKAGFQAIDSTKKGDATVTVNANTLIDLMIAYGDAIKGDIGNLEWALAVQAATCQGAIEILDQANDKRMNQGDFCSSAALMYQNDPYTYALKNLGGESGVIAAGKASFLAINGENKHDSK